MADLLEKKKEYNIAFKRVTVVYAWEKGKDDGMSARTVADLIRNDCGISDCNSKQQRKRLLRYSSKVSPLICPVLLTT
jgi:hypothetical protein